MSSNPTHITAPDGTPFIEVVREFDAPAALVFRASTDPGLVAQWLGPRDMAMQVIEFDARPGGSYRYVHVAPDGAEAAFRGVFHTVTEALTVQTFEFEGAPGSVSLETTRRDDIGGRTLMRHSAVFPSVAARDMALAAGMERGINDSMDRLAELLAAGAARPGR